MKNKWICKKCLVEQSSHVCSSCILIDESDVPCAAEPDSCPFGSGDANWEKKEAISLDERGDISRVVIDRELEIQK